MWVVWCLRSGSLAKPQSPADPEGREGTGDGGGEGNQQSSNTPSSLQGRRHQPLVPGEEPGARENVV